MVILDMPWGSYQNRKSRPTATRYARFTRIARASREDGGRRGDGGNGGILGRARHSVMPHIGLMPQRVSALGGFKAQGKADAAAKWTRIARDFRSGRRVLGVDRRHCGAGGTRRRRIGFRAVIGIGASPALRWAGAGD